MHSGHLITLFSARNYFKRAGTGATGGFPRTHNLHTQYTHTHNTYIQHAHANTRKHTQTHTLKIHTHTNDASSSCSTSNHDQKPCAPTAKPLETAVPETAVCNTIGQLAESNDGALLLVAMDDAGNLRVRPKRLRHRLVEQPAGGGPPASASDDESGQQRSCCLFILPTRLSNARVLFLFSSHPSLRVVSFSHPSLRVVSFSHPSMRVVALVCVARAHPCAVFAQVRSRTLRHGLTATATGRTAAGTTQPGSPRESVLTEMHPGDLPLSLYNIVIAIEVSPASVAVHHPVPTCRGSRVKAVRADCARARHEETGRRGARGRVAAVTGAVAAVGEEAALRGVGGVGCVDRNTGDMLLLDGGVHAHFLAAVPPKP